VKESALVIIKPDGISKRLAGDIVTRFAQADLEIVGIRVVMASTALAHAHYKHLQYKPFFSQIVSYLAGKYHKTNKLIAIVYYGTQAIKRCRKVAGDTNPEKADPQSIRGAYGRITTDGLFENIVHVSSDKREAEREIKLWFDPDDIIAKIYPAATKKIALYKKKVWI
jgi:nucleoside-diphosphate kinase